MYNEAHRPVFLSTTFPLPQNTFVLVSAFPRCSWRSKSSSTKDTFPAKENSSRKAKELGVVLSVVDLKTLKLFLGVPYHHLLR